MSIFVDIHKKLKGFSLDVKFETGEEVTGLLGASGSGKSMTLRCIAGVEKPDSGKIIVDGVVYFDSEKKINLRTQERHVGYLFQNYALFPNMTVEDNILIGMKRDPKVQELFEELIGRFQLRGLERRYPSQLSGGQQQRVALARIFIRSPKILMLDEPFSALDTSLRWELQKEIKEILENYGHTVLFVSHSRDEIFRVCEKAGIMDNGKMDTFDSVRTLFANPKTVAAARLTGCKNIAKIKRIEDHVGFVPEWGVVLKTSQKITPETEYIGIRAHFFYLAGADETNAVPVRVVRVIESQFTVSVLFEPKNKEHVAAPMCWDYERVYFEEKEKVLHPKYLAIDPKNIVLLKGGPTV